MMMVEPAHAIFVLAVLSNKEGSGETVHMHRLASAFAARMYVDKDTDKNCDFYCAT